MERLIEIHKLFDDTYLAVFESCLAIYKTDENDEFSSLSIYGHAGLKDAEKRNARLF